MKDKAARARLVKLRLNISSAGPPGSTVSGKAVSIGGDGSFTVSALRPGSVIFSLSLNEDYREAIGFRWSRLEHNGVEKTETLQVAAGDQITNVRLVYLTGNSSLSGVVKCEPGPCPPAMRGTARLFRGNTFIAGALVDTRGNFFFESIPAGEYKLVVTPEAPGFRGASPAPQQIDIAEGTNLEISVTVNLSPTSN